MQWAMKADKTYFWKGGRRSGTKAEPPQEIVASLRKVGSMIYRNKSEECVSFLVLLTNLVEKLSLHLRDEAQLNKLKELGMTPGEEAKLLALRDYVLKLANAVSRYALFNFASISVTHVF